jgi:predicted PurR-regulated permease PerM
MQDKKNIKATFLKYFPANIKGRTEEIVDNISSKMGGYVFAQTMAVLSVFIVNVVGLLILQNPYAISIAVIAAILDIVPVVGPAIAIVICLIGVYEFGAKVLISTFIVMVLAQLVENNLVRPYAFSKLMDLHPTIIFLSLILGGKYFGFIGVLFGPAMAATICVLLDELYVRNITENEENVEIVNKEQN